MDVSISWAIPLYTIILLQSPGLVCDVCSVRMGSKRVGRLQRDKRVVGETKESEKLESTQWLDRQKAYPSAISCVDIEYGR